MRSRTNFVRGTVDDNPLGSGATTLTSTELSDLPAVASPDIAVIVLDPEGAAPEIVHVTAHTASATTATILRAQEGTSAAAWVLGTVWRHTPTVEDFGDGAVVGSFTISDVRPNSTSLVQWGTEEGTVASADLPAANFMILAWLRGRARKIGTTTQHRRFQYELEYSLDGGTVWVAFTAVIIGTDSSNTTTSRTPCNDSGGVPLTDTGNGVMVRAACSDVDVANDFNFENGRVTYMVVAA